MGLGLMGRLSLRTFGTSLSVEDQQDVQHDKSAFVLPSNFPQPSSLTLSMVSTQPGVLSR